MLKVKEMNGTQKIAYKNIKACFNYEVGGWYNCLQDGYEEDIPETIEQAKEIIYDGSLNCTYGEGSCSMRAKDEVRFAGKEFINEVIDALFEKDEDIKEIAEVKGWFKKEEETMSGTLEIKEVKDELTGEVAEVVTKETEEGIEFEEIPVEDRELVECDFGKGKTVLDEDDVEEAVEEEAKEPETFTVTFRIAGEFHVVEAVKVKIGWRKIVIVCDGEEDPVIIPRKVKIMEIGPTNKYAYADVELDGKGIPTRTADDPDFRGQYRRVGDDIIKEAL